jgi:hypothetical protein
LEDKCFLTGNPAQTGISRPPPGAGRFEVEMDDEGAFQDEQKSLTGKLG